MVEDIALMSVPLGALPGTAVSIMEHRSLEIWSLERGLLESGQMKSR